MTNYKILEINKKDKWVKIEVIFDDGEKYVKRMMAPVTDKEKLIEAINKWFNDYLPLREVEESVPKEVKDLIGIKQTMVEKEKPPKTKEVSDG